MKVVLKVTPRNMLIATLMPIACAALFVVATWLSGLNRYDSSYFTDEYLERYGTPGTTAMVLAEALRANDTELLAELQGLRRPRKFATSPNMSLGLLYEITDTYHLLHGVENAPALLHLTVYYSYMYYDTHTHKHYIHHFEEVRGRWVLAPEDAYYSLRSGDWLKVFVPISLSWWIAEVVFLLGHGVFRLTRRWAADVRS